MPLLIVCMLLFILLGILWVIGAGLLFGAFLSETRTILEKILDFKGEKCACHFPFRGHAG